jgi:DNA-binding NtrC family response regulator
MNADYVVMVVDDDEDIRRAARLALAPKFARIETVASPGDMEALLDGGSFHVVLLDMNYGGHRDGRDGLEALNRVRNFDATVAVVMMTAYAGVALAVDALKQGAVDFVMKPWRNERLIEAVGAAAEMACGRRQVEGLPLDAVERQTIERALTRHQGNISSAAAALGVSRAALYRRKVRYGL